MLSIIVAIAQNNVIGKDNALLWHITEDMKYFRRVTSGHSVIMGRKTYESIGRPLPKRRNLVVSRQQNLVIEGCECYRSLEEAIAATKDEEETFIIGGAQIYGQSINLADRLYVTKVEISPEGDAKFPEIDPEVWKLDSSEIYPKGESFEYPFAFQVYSRR